MFVPGESLGVLQSMKRTDVKSVLFFQTARQMSSGKDFFIKVRMLFVHALGLVKKPGPKVIKLFSCSTQLSTKFQLLIKTKISTNIEDSCFKSLRCCIYLANKC